MSESQEVCLLISCATGNLATKKPSFNLPDYDVSGNLAVFHEWVLRQTQQCQDCGFDCKAYVLRVNTMSY